MSLKKAILDVMAADRLKELADDLQVEGPHKARSAVVDALHRADVHSGELLSRMDEVEVRSAAEAFKVRTDGKREAIIERLLCTEAYRDSGSEIALYEDGPFVALELALASAERGPREVVALAAVRVEGRCVARPHLISIRPPGRGRYRVARELRSAAELGEHKLAEGFEEIRDLFAGIAYVATHNAERTVKRLKERGVDVPPLPFQSTSVLARRVWGLKRARLEDVTAQLGLERPCSLVERAEAVARVVLRAQKEARSRC